jgi:hypothetical protein
VRRRACGQPAWVLYNYIMEKQELKEVVDRVLTWPEEDQEKVLRFVDELEEWGAQHSDRISE